MIPNAIEVDYVLALYLREHPGAVVREYERGKFIYYRYDQTTNKYYWRCPENKCQNGWYEARGLSNWFRVGEKKASTFLYGDEDAETEALPF